MSGLPSPLSSGLADTKESIMKTVLGTVLWGGVFIVFLGVFGLIGRGCGWLGGVSDEVFDPQKNVYTYEQFYRDFQSTKKFRAGHDMAKAEFDRLTELRKTNGLSPYEQEELSVYSSAILGNKNQHNEVAARYNANADMKTRSWLLGKNLPEHIGLIR